MAKNLTINAKDEVHKIAKYKKKMEQVGGEDRNYSYYKIKLNEHKYRLSKAGYSPQDIERMIQKGGEDNSLMELAQKAKDAIENIQCNTDKGKLEEISKENEELKKQNEAEKESLKKEIEDLKKAKEEESAKVEKALQDSATNQGMKEQIEKLEQDKKAAEEKAAASAAAAAAAVETHDNYTSKEEEIRKILEQIETTAREKAKGCAVGGNLRTLSQIADGIRKF